MWQLQVDNEHYSYYFSTILLMKKDYTVLLIQLDGNLASDVSTVNSNFY